MAFVSPPHSFLESPGTPEIPWVRWVKMFQNFMLASIAKDFDDERKRAILLHSLGIEGQRIFYSLPELEKDTKGKIKIEPGETFTDTDDSVYVQSLLMLERHFKPSQNKLTARIKFKQRSQLPGETVDEFLLALRQLIVPCDYPHAVEDELVRDQFVQFCKTPFFQTRIVQEKNVSLNNVIQIARQLEQSSKDVKVLKADSLDTVAETVKYLKSKKTSDKSKNKNDRDEKQKQRFHSRKPQYEDKQRKNPDGKKCYRCGSDTHLANSKFCRAKNSICRKCKIRGHWDAVCRSGTRVKQIHESDVSDNSETEEEFFVCHTSASKSHSLSVHCDVEVDNVPLRLLVDTGSPRTLMSESDFNQYFRDTILLNPECSLKSYAMTNIELLGCFQAHVKYNGTPLK